MKFDLILDLILKRSAARVLVAATLLTCAMLAGGGSIAHAKHGGWTMGPSPRDIVNPPPRAIDASCVQRMREPGQLVWREIPKGSNITVPRGTQFSLRLFYTRSGGPERAVEFTATANTNVFLGPAHRVDTGFIAQPPINRPLTHYVDWPPSGDWPRGPDIIHIDVTSDATGDTVLASCDVRVTLRDPDRDNPADSDGDGLLDTWETNGIDVNHDGTVDLPLNAAPYNADPDKRDVFVEVDYMSCALSHPWSTGCALGITHDEQPVNGALNEVETAFAKAPSSNDHHLPDHLPGINLHHILDEAVPHIDGISFASDTSPSKHDFGDLKNGIGTNGPDHCGTGAGHGFFGTATDRASLNCEQILFAKALVYHYAIFGHSYRPTPTDPVANSSGISDGVNDFMVTLGSWNTTDIQDAGGGNARPPRCSLLDASGVNTCLRTAQAATFMHELGHDLGLKHGGAVDTNCKPNYRSVMNYPLQFPNIDTTRPLDYSRYALGFLPP